MRHLALLGEFSECFGVDPQRRSGFLERHHGHMILSSSSLSSAASMRIINACAAWSAVPDGAR